MINFVSNIPADLRSGGFSAMNNAALYAARQVADVHYVGPVSPPPSSGAKILSKLARTFGRPGDFFFFSQARLQRIAEEVANEVRPDAQLDFFHGFTPWIQTRAERPYAAWSDCIFLDYIDVFHAPVFRQADLDRIAKAEAEWLRAATRVGFSSAWAAKRAVEAYGLDEDKVDLIGVCGEFEVPDTDVYDGSRQIAFISTNFEAKGGREVLDAFAHVRRSHPAATLVIVGDQPKGAVGEGVEVIGFLKKENPEQSARLRDIFARSRAVVNLSRSDTAPVLLIEAAYFGCPVVSSRRFAIPEIVDDARTGFLIDGLHDVDALAGAIKRLLEDDDNYGQMRAAAWASSRRRFSRGQFDQNMATFLKRAIHEAASRAQPSGVNAF